MDRLYFVVPLLALLLACDTGEAPAAAAPPGRVVAVKAKPSDVDPIDTFCDVRGKPGAGAAFALPQAVEGTPRTHSGQRRWVNLWASWCKPCVEEIPMLVDWQKRMKGDGVEWALELVSVDADASAVATFRAEHPGVPETLRITEADALPKWIADLGLDSGAGLPIHAFVDASDKLRCVRAGGVVADDFDTVERILR